MKFISITLFILFKGLWVGAWKPMKLKSKDKQTTILREWFQPPNLSLLYQLLNLKNVFILLIARAIVVEKFSRFEP